MKEKKIQNLTSSLEDYLECIYNKISLNNSVKAIEISRALNVSRASVTEALNKLAQKEYIKYGRYGAISITELGIVKAKEIINKHKVLQDFFEKVLEIEKSEATKTACKIEHIISDEVIVKLSRLTTYFDKKSKCKAKNK
jgi:DtxR family Mn-dependent transcriptional regulator